ncbi:MAG: ABC transporter permease [Cellulomonas sp.]
MTGGSALRTGLALLVLLAVFLAVTTAARVPVRRETVVAVLRGAVQLVAVAVVIAWVFRHPAAAGLYLAVMVSVAAWTATRRIGLGPRTLAPVGLAVLAGATTAVVPVVASGALVVGAPTLVPFGAQMIGGAMAAASVTGLRLREDLRTEWDVVEGWLALGATGRQAVTGHARRAVARALVPGIDQTRSAGLVTLPGAFVGLLLGGASPAEAAQVQVLVLVGLLAAQAVSGVLTTSLLAGRLGAARPAEPDPLLRTPGLRR